MSEEDKLFITKELCLSLPFGIRGKVEANCVVPNKYDIDGFPVETTFEVDVELEQVNVSTYELFVSAVTDNENLGNYIWETQTDGMPWTVEDFKPYLRPVSSMTDSEMGKLFDILHIDKYGKDEDWIKINDVTGIKFFLTSGRWMEEMDEALLYLRSIHVDINGLLPKKLAIEAPDGIYTKNK